MATLAVAPAIDPTSTVLDCGEAPIDRAHLARYTFGNRVLELEVLELFAEHAPRYLDNLRLAGTEKSWRDAAHTLKGSAQAVGAFRVAERAEQAEEMFEAADAEVRALVVVLLSVALDEACRHIALLAASG